MIKESIHEENALVLNVYVPIYRTLKYRKQTLRELRKDLKIHLCEWFPN